MQNYTCFILVSKTFPGERVFPVRRQIRSCNCPCWPGIPRPLFLTVIMQSLRLSKLYKVTTGSGNTAVS